MIRILCLETSAHNCSVGLCEDGRLIVSHERSSDGYTHAEDLHVFIQTVLRESGIEVSDLSAVAVSQGPGSYTGLRIGVSAAKGLCYAHSLPLIALDTTRVIYNMARTAHLQAPVIVTMIDARRMEVYEQSFTVQGGVSKLTASVVDETWIRQFSSDTIFAGDGAFKVAAFGIDEGRIWRGEPAASGMVKLATEAWNASSFEDLAYFEPRYLKEFVPGKQRDLLSGH